MPSKSALRNIAIPVEHAIARGWPLPMQLEIILAAFPGLTVAQLVALTGAEMDATRRAVTRLTKGKIILRSRGPLSLKARPELDPDEERLIALRRIAVRERRSPKPRNHLAVPVEAILERARPVHRIEAILWGAWPHAVPAGDLLVAAGLGARPGWDALRQARVVMEGDQLLVRLRLDALPMLAHNDPRVVALQHIARKRGTTYLPLRYLLDHRAQALAHCDLRMPVDALKWLDERWALRDEWWGKAAEQVSKHHGDVLDAVRTDAEASGLTPANLALLALVQELMAAPEPARSAVGYLRSQIGGLPMREGGSNGVPWRSPVTSCRAAAPKHTVAASWPTIGEHLNGRPKAGDLSPSRDHLRLVSFWDATTERRAS
jgi:hypothetical protein